MAPRKPQEIIHTERGPILKVSPQDATYLNQHSEVRLPGAQLLTGHQLPEEISPRVRFAIGGPDLGINKLEEQRYNLNQSKLQESRNRAKPASEENE